MAKCAHVAMSQTRARESNHLILWTCVVGGATLRPTTPRTRHTSDTSLTMSPASSLHALALAALVALSAGLKAHDFRKCGDTPFCALHRAAPAPPWTLNASSLAYDESRLTVQLLPSSTAPPEARSLPTVLALCVFVQTYLKCLIL